MKILCLFLITFCLSANAAREPVVAPYIDATRMPENYLVDIHQQTGLNSVTLAFVLGSASGCQPSWGGEFALNDSKIINNTKAFKNIGGNIIIATGGAMGPYLESSCQSADQLADAYHKALTIVDSTHLDIDIEAPVNVDLMLNALKRLRTMIPSLTVSFTMMVQGDDYGIVDILGVNILKQAVNMGVEVNIVNAMTMEFGSKLTSWGDAVIAASESLHHQMKQIWPHKSDLELYTMIGVTPMIGRNFNGKIFTQEHAQKLVDWAKQKKIGHLSFWSIGRDNGGCPGGGISPTCSSIAQDNLEFCKIFNKYSNEHIPDEFPTTLIPDLTTTSDNYITSSNPFEITTTTPTKIDCSNNEEFIPHEKYCGQYYWCYDGKPHLEHCPNHLVWDQKIHSCNYPQNAQRNDCIME